MFTVNTDHQRSEREFRMLKNNFERVLDYVTGALFNGTAVYWRESSDTSQTAIEHHREAHVGSNCSVQVLNFRKTV